MQVNVPNRIYSEPAWRIIAWQHLSYALSKSYLFITNSTVDTTQEWLVDTSKKYVIAANHIRPLDPFVITTALGWKRLRPMLPCRFITAPKFLTNPFMRTLLRQLGSYPSHSFKDWAYGIEASTELLSQKNTIVIFPQGKMTTNPEYPAKRGISVLASQSNTLIVPIYIKKKTSLLKGYRIIVGEPFNGSAKTAEEITKCIYSLDK